MRSGTTTSAGRSSVLYAQSWIGHDTTTILEQLRYFKVGLDDDVLIMNNESLCSYLKFIIICIYLKKTMIKTSTEKDKEVNVTTCIWTYKHNTI